MIATADPLSEILARFPGAKKNGNGYMVRCPAHDDGHASLSIGAGKEGRVLVNCHAGCTAEMIVAKLGMKMSDLFPPREHHNGNGSPRKIAAAYDYLSPDGELVYQAVRTSPKGFFQRRPDGKGGWINNMDGI